jgi:hypothetical protein
MAAPPIPPTPLGLTGTPSDLAPNLDSLERAATPALNPVFTADAIGLWRPRGSTGLPGQRISGSASFAA